MDCPSIATTSHVRLAVPASNQKRLDRLWLSATTDRPTSASRYDHSAAFNDSTNLSFLQRSSSCIQLLDRPQLPTTTIQLHSTTRPTSPSCNDRPAAFNNSTDFSCPQRLSSFIQLLDRSQLTCIKHLAVSPWLNLHQLPSSNVQLCTSTTRPYQLST